MFGAMTRRLGALLGAAMLAAAAPAWAGDPAPAAAEPLDSRASRDPCSAPIVRAERAHRVPRHLLAAIARVESGRWDRDSGVILAWPWTVTAEGRGRFLPTKAAAIAEVEALRARGVRNIDVGCMQINLRYHPNAFETLEQAFDPAANVAYAVRYLRDLRAQWGSWTRAVGNYHSNTPTLSGRYRAKIMLARSDMRHEAARARRAARLSAGS
jgi:soluble lytic murein transglycosylase-like protein